MSNTRTQNLGGYGLVKQLAFLLMLLGFGFITTTVTHAQVRTPWQMHRGEDVVHFGFNSPGHGDPVEFSFATIPPSDDAGWEDAPNGDVIGFSEPSTLCGVASCRDAGQFTYFQTFLLIPAGTEVTEFTIRFSGIDDGTETKIFNSLFPDGVVVPGSYVALGGSGTANLSSLVVAGEVNRVVVTHVDDCCVNSILGSAQVSLNGILVDDTNLPFVSVKIRDTIPNQDVSLVTESLTRQPSQIIDNGDNTTTIEWNLGVLFGNSVQTLEFDLELSNLIPGETRLVNHQLELVTTHADGLETTETLGPSFVDVGPIYELSIDADQDSYLVPDIANLTTALNIPEDLTRVVLTDQADFEAGTLNQVDVTSQPGQVRLADDGAGSFFASGTISLVIDAGSSVQWGTFDIDASAGAEDRIFSELQNEIVSDQARDVFVYDTSQDDVSDSWRSNVSASWHQEADQTIVGNALSTLDGGGVRVADLPAIGADLGNQWTIEGWWRGEGLFTFKGSFAANATFMIYRFGNQIFLEQFDFVTGGFWSKSVSFTPDPSHWQHVAFTSDGTTATFYINGQQVGQWADFPGDLPSGPLSIGFEDEGFLPVIFEPDAVPRAIDEYRIYDRPLTALEIDRTHDRGRQHLSSDVDQGLVAYWNFDVSPADQGFNQLGGEFHEGLDAFTFEVTPPGRITGRSSDTDFPQKAILILSDGGLDIYDAVTFELWMRVLTDRPYLWSTADQTPTQLFARNGVIYIGQSSSADEGLAILDFVNDEARNITPTGSFRVDLPIIDRNSTREVLDPFTFELTSSYSRMPISGTVALLNGLVNDVSARAIAGVDFIAVATESGLTLVRDEQVVMHHEDVATPVSRVTLTSNDDLYFTTRTGITEDSLRVVYDQSIVSDGFTSSTAYGHDGIALGTTSFETNEIHDLTLVEGESTVNVGDNILYVATSGGVVEVQEFQGNESAGVGRTFGSSVAQSAHVDVPVLAGDTDFAVSVAVDDDLLWIGTRDDSPSGEGALSIVSRADDQLVKGVNSSSDPALPSTSMTSVVSSLIGTDSGAMLLRLGLIDPIIVQMRGALLPGQLASQQLIQVDEFVGAPVPVDQSRYLEIIVTLQTDNPAVTPSLDEIRVGYNDKTYRVDVTVEDTQQNHVADVDVINVQSIDFGFTRSVLDRFATAQVVAGNYVARADLVDLTTDEVVATATDPFEVLSTAEGELVGGSIATDRRIYTEGQTATLISKVSNDSENVLLDDLSVSVSVTAPDDSLLQTFQYEIATLPVGSVHKKDLLFDIVNLPIGTYRVQQTVTRADASALVNETTFEVISSIDLGLGVAGTLSVDPASVSFGDDIDFDLSVQNTGNVDLVDVDLVVSVLNPTSFDVLETFTQAAGDLAIDSDAKAFTVDFDGVSLNAGSYPVILNAQFDHEGQPQQVPLDIDGFTVTNSPPVANAGPDQSVVQTGPSGAAVTLDGSASTDPDSTNPPENDNDIATYQWAEGSTTLGTGETLAVTLGVGEHTITLTVTDQAGVTDTDTVVITVTNAPPVADAGADQSVVQTGANGATVSLDGSASTDASSTNPPDLDDDIASYEWKEGSTVLGSGETLNVLLAVGEHTITLTVTDSQGAADTDTVVVTVTNAPPIADAGEDQSIVQTATNGATVTLDGSGSTDASSTNPPELDDDITSYEWKEGSTVLGSGETLDVLFAVGEHTITLTVTDSQGATDTDTVVITVTNAPPVADAGADQSVVQTAANGVTVTLDGSESTDASSTNPPDLDDDIASYEWKEGSTVLGVGEMLDVLFAVGEHTVTLTVTDTQGATDTDTVVITVTNAPPIADAGTDQSVVQTAANGATVTLDGSGSTDASSTNPPDLDDDIASYEWKEGSTVLGSGETLEALFAVGEHTVTLTVTDTQGATDTDTVVITITNAPPVADAGPDQSVVQTAANGATVTLDGSASTDASSTNPPDLDDDIASYEWKEGSTVLGSGETLDVLFTVGEHTVTLTATDSQGATDTDTVVITITNAPPIADAGADQSVVQTAANGATVTLDGSGSTDASSTNPPDLDNDIASYEWKEASTVLGSGETLDVLFAVGEHTITLTVTDSQGATDTDTVVITITNAPPIADAGADQSVVQTAANGATVTLDGSASTDASSGNPPDLDDDIASYEWKEGSTVLGSGETLNTLFAVGEHTVTLTVTDSQGATDTDTVVVTVTNAPPIADAGADQSVVQTAANGATVTLDGTASTDASSTNPPDLDDDIASYEWKEGSTVLGSGETLDVLFAVGEHTVTLTVTDSQGAADSDTVVITVTNAPPVADAGADQSVVQTAANGTTVTLDGSGSTDASSGNPPDLDDDITSYEWKEGSTVLGSGETLDVLFAVGEHTVTLTVTDSQGATDADTVVVTVTNAPPIADAGEDQSVVQTAANGATATLDGSGSTDASSTNPPDLDDDIASYEWKEGSTVLGSGETLDVLFAVGEHTVNLTVTDSQGATGTDTVVITISNAPPIADAGTDQSVVQTAANGATVTLDGSGSTDASSTNPPDLDDDIASYEWKEGSTVLGSGETLDVLFAVGEHTVTLTVTDSQGATDTDTVVISVTNAPPVADAGADQSVVQTAANGATVTLDGSSSTDASSTNPPDLDDDIAFYEWKEGSTVLGSGETLDVLFAVGEHTITLTVTDSQGAADTDTVVITVTNAPPIADAGTDQSVVQTAANGATVTLDGSESTDASSTNPPDLDDDIASYEWKEGSTVLGVGETLDVLFAVGEHTVTLTVTDTQGATDTDTVVVTVTNAPPVADAGADRSVVQTAANGATVTLDGSSSTDASSTNPPDLDDDIASYEWKEGSTVLGSGETLDVLFAVGEHTLTLTVTDTQGATDTDTVVITVTNAPPVADAGSDQSVVQTAANGATVTLDGSGSTDASSTNPPDLDDDIASYEWKEGSTVLGSVKTLDVLFAVGEHTITLTVTDSQGATDTDTVVVTVTNAPPVADAGVDQSVAQTASNGATVTLDGSASTDASSTNPPDLDDDIASYEWKEGSAVLGSGETLDVLFAVGEHTVTLTVTDSQGATGTDTVVVTVTNAPPIADAGADQSVIQTAANGATVTLDGSDSTDASSTNPPDLDDDIASYEWKEGSTVLGNGETLDVLFAVGEHTVTLTVTDTQGATDTDTVVITVTNAPPIADAGADQSVAQTAANGATVTLDGSGSTDASSTNPPDLDDDIASYEWKEGSTVLGSGQTLDVLFAVGVHTVTLTVTDSQGATDTDTVIITVTNAPPVADAGADQSEVQTAASGATVTLDGSGSTDASSTNPPDLDDDIATYEWKEGSTVLGSGETLNTLFAVGQHTVTLTVTDSQGASDTDTVVVNVTNAPPVADAGADQVLTQTSAAGVAVTFDGGGSTDVSSTNPPDLDNDIASYEWRIGTTVIGTGEQIVKTLGLGTHTVTLTVTDTAGATDSDTVSVTVNNAPPIADAGTDQSVVQTAANGATVTLDGSDSTDVSSTNPPDLDNDIVAYQWKEGSTVLGSGETLDVLFAVGAHTVTLTVTDSKGATSSDTVVITVTNAPPVANAGQDATVTLASPQGAFVLLDGSGSTDISSTNPPALDNDIVSYQWKEGSTVLGSGETLNTILGVGAHTITLTVTDTAGGTGTDSVVVTVEAPTCARPSVTSGLVLYLSMDEGLTNPAISTVVDESGLGNNASILGSRFVSGVICAGLSFDGQDDLLTVADSPSIDVTSNTTFAFWVRVAGPNDDRTMALLSKKDAFDSSTGYAIDYNPGQNLLRLHGGGNNIAWAENVDLDTGWHHIAVAVTPGGSSWHETTFYMDGVDVTTNTSVSKLNVNDLELLVGRYVQDTGGLSLLQGAVDEVRIYNRALAVSEIQTLATFTTATLNNGPVVNAGPDVTIALPTNQVSFNASVADDGLPNPPAAVAVQWSLLDGPNSSVIFSNQASVSTDVTFPESGIYTFRFTADDGEIQTFDDVSVLVVPEPDLTRGVVAHWTFDEQSGDVAIDVSGNENHGNVVGALFETGRIGNGLDFDGVNDYVDVSAFDVRADDSSQTSQMTIAGWFYADDFGTEDARLISKATGTAAADHWWMLSTIRDGDIRLRARLKTDDGGTMTLIADQGDVLAGQWHHAAMIYDGLFLRLYLDGQEVGSVAKSGAVSVDSSVQIRIGDNPVGNRYFDGLIDDVRIYNRALSVVELDQLANPGASPNTSPIADAGDDVVTELPNDTVLLIGFANDDGLPSSTLVYDWSVISGPGTVTFDDPTRIDVSATFSVAGTYVLRFTVDDGELISFDELTVTVIPPVDVQSNLVAHWHFDDGSGDEATDASGNGHHGTINGASFEAGIIGNALRFDGTNDSVNAGSFDVVNSGGAQVSQVTIAAWFNADDFGTADARIISKATGTASADHWWMLSTVDDGGTKRLRVRLKTGSSTTTLIADSGDLSAGQWIHAAFVYDGSILKIFKNGQVVGSTSVTGLVAVDSGVGVQIGNSPVTGRPFDGLIDDVRVYSRALTDNDVQSLATPGPANNVAPQASAGPDIVVLSVTDDASLSATVTDDGFPVGGTLTSLWSVVSGPGSVVFGNASSINTTASFSVNGTYVIRLTAGDGDLITIDDLVVTVGDTLSQGLIAHWDFDEGSGSSAADITGNGHAGTIQGASFSDARIGSYSLRFDGNNDYVDLDTMDVLPVGSGLTISTWIKADDFGTSDGRIVSKATGTSTSSHWWMLSTVKKSGKYRLRFRLKADGSTSTLIASSGDLSAGQWVHATVTYDGFKMRIYMDGVLVGSTNKSGSINLDPNVGVRIGGNPVGGKHFDGRIDDVRIYNRALDASQVQDLAQQ